MRHVLSNLLFGSLFLTALVAGTSGCKEVNPLGTAAPVDTATSVQQKNILIEDITGVRCPNCPEGHEKAQQLQDANPGRVEVVAIHNGDLSSPFAFSAYDFRIPQGAQIDNFLGPADYWPKGSIDRKEYGNTGETGILMGRNYWIGNGDQRLTDTLRVDVGLSKSYNAATRKFDLDVTLHYLADVADAQKITVYLTESGLMDAQEFPDHIDTFYVHDNVLRTVLTDVQGDPITETTASGTDVQRSYSFTLPAAWNPQNCRAIVFVSRNTSDPSVGKEVLQVSGINVQ